MPANAAVLALLSRQDGLITAAQASACGLPERTLRRRVQDDGWQRVAPRTYLAGGHPMTAAARVRAAGLWAGRRGTVSGPAAAWWHGMLDQPPGEVEITMPRQLGLRARPGVRIRRRDLHPADRVGKRGLWLTDRPLTALETAAVLPDGSAFLDRALQKHVTFDRVYGAYCRNLGTRGAAGIAVLLTAAADRADSAAERRLLTILRRSGVTGWTCGRPFGRWTIDLAFPASRIAIEVDGWAWHVDVDRFRADRHKGNALVRAGWTLLRFTWHDLVNRPAHVIGEITSALRAATATVPAGSRP